ncbi:hypothetical protein PPL_07745 [Heterostelium album PN500]|uniref:Uncharacterized protein n=1 Tax=Heterostelium pallidum (strain ATCC 26659 / Pp 5 / PN500) TaxID=670386 RepID=D3BGU3_HETP5|nr:hypothetical protein PPL_07745 [Heterostelium album PN500]EFA79327.1 hypothetical protein PPL_07745 [Heterostelium album PN500]|eukprot:XP_020431448.1 hypothetical protein PPL_07745 [Heterostelium album PN500]
MTTTLTNNNDNHIFVNFSHFLLKKIVRNLKIVDSIRFTLVSKKWFQERDKYLLFEDEVQPEDLIYLLSFKKIRFDIDFPQTRLFIVDEINDTHYEDNYSQYETPDDELTIKRMEGIREVFFEVDNLNIAKYKEILEKSNVQIVSARRIEQLTPGSLPSKLKNLDIDDYPFRLESNHLPSSLENLSLLSNNHNPFQISSLPPNLKSLTFFRVFGEIAFEDIRNVNILPKTLTKIKNCPYQWIKFLKNLPFLTTLQITENIPNGYLEPGDFPESLTNLSLQSPIELIESLIPQSIQHLNLPNCILDLSSNELPRSSHFQSLCVKDINSPILPNQLPPYIKELNLIKYNQELVPGSLPNGIETLKLPTLDAGFLYEGVIPSSTKNLHLFEAHSENPFKASSIPNAVETLELGSLDSDIDFGMIPNSVCSITCNIGLIKKYGINSIKSTVNHIKIIGELNYEFDRIDQNWFFAYYCGYSFIQEKSILNLLEKDKPLVNLQTCQTQ